MWYNELSSIDSAVSTSTRKPVHLYPVWHGYVLRRVNNSSICMLDFMKWNKFKKIMRHGMIFCYIVLLRYLILTDFRSMEVLKN